MSYNRKFTPDFIRTLGPGQVFVFGSNLAGHHAGGAAQTALRMFGAEMGNGEGPQGRSYAIPTMQTPSRHMWPGSSHTPRRTPSKNFW